MASQYLRRVYRVFPAERIKQFIRNFRIIPGLTLNPVSNEMEISFQSSTVSLPLLEDALNLTEQLSGPNRRTLVIFDEFQDVMRLGKKTAQMVKTPDRHTGSAMNHAALNTQN